MYTYTFSRAILFDMEMTVHEVLTRIHFVALCCTLYFANTLSASAGYVHSSDAADGLE